METTELVVRIEEAKRLLENARNQIMVAARDTLVAQWKALGGCERCLGWERVVTWSTLDGASWTEYGPCEKCTPSSRAAGKAPSSSWWGGYHAAGIDAPRNLPANTHADDVARVAALANAIAFFESAEARERSRAVVRKGSKVEVFKGRKVPVGTRGTVIWIGSGQYGERVGVKDAAGTAHWTSMDNVRVQGGEGSWPSMSPAMTAQLVAILDEMANGRALLNPLPLVLAPAPAAPVPAAAPLAPSRVVVLEIDVDDKPATAPTTTVNVERFRLLEID